MIRVAVVGAAGRMGSTVCAAVDAADDMEVLAKVDLGDPLDLVDDCDVVVDFTAPDVVMETLRHCVPAGVHVVVGTSGFDTARLAQVEDLLQGHPDVGVLVAPNFSIGAVLMMRFAATAAPFFESVEVIEMHHPDKVVSRTELVEHLYDQDFDRDSNTIEVFVGRLRKKMGVDLIETVRGMGYRLRADAG